jgi:gliding motility-associated-like protein
MKKIFLFTTTILLAFSSNVFSQPITLSTTNITTTTADLNWDPSNCSGNVTLHYKISGTTWPGTSVSSATSPYVLSALAPNTDYEWRVKCAGTSSWSAVQQISTLCAGVLGCTDPIACNYNLSATCDNGSCLYPGCTDVAATNYDPLATCSGGTCTYPIYGCTDLLACNYNLLADINDGSCILQDGCNDLSALNYDPLALCNDGSCDYPISGCTNNLACNYNALASVDDGSCLTSFGCTLPLANNYNPLATCNDGSCTFSGLAISNAIISNQILCNGGFAFDSLQVDINQTSPTSNYTCLVGYYLGNPTIPNPGVDIFISYLSTAATFSTQLNLNGFLPNYLSGANAGQAINYFVRIVDTASYNPTHNNGNGPGIVGIIDQFGPITFLEPAPLTVNTSLLSSNLCAGNCIAKEKVIITGGTKPYNYVFDTNPQVTLGPSVITTNISSLCSGTYNLVITDANGCPSIPSPSDFTINSISPIITSGFSPVFNSNGYHISCNGAADGTINASASGGTGGFIYSIDGTNFQPYPIFSGLLAGTYTIYYKDANSCIGTEILTLNEPPALSGTASITQAVDCYNENTGEITFTVAPAQPGIPPYAYSIDNGANSQPSSTLTNLTGNISYPLMIEDNNGCSFTDTIYLAEPTQIIYSSTVSNYNGFGVSCNGDSDGIITISAAGGTGTLTYSLDAINYQSSPIFSGLSAVTHTVSYKDANGCEFTTDVSLTEPGVFSVSHVSSNYSGADISCFGYSDGEIISTDLNGVGPVLYEFNNNSILTTNSIWDSLSSGVYNIYAEDLNGCNDVQIITLNDPPLLTTSLIIVSHDYCNNADGELEIIASGGIGQISYNWTNGQNSSIISGLTSGNYECIVSDINGCDVPLSATIIDDIPFQIAITSTPTCFGASQATASVTLVPNGNYVLNNPTYLWDDPSAQVTQVATNLAVGNYTITVNDLSCSVNASLVIDTPSAPLFIESIDVSQVTCHNDNNGEIVVHALGIPPYSYSLNSNPLTNDSVFSNLTGGNYQILVEDFSGCTSLQTVNIVNPDVILVGPVVIDSVSCFGECDASIVSIQASGGTPFSTGYSYLYSLNVGLPHPNTSYFNGYCADTYTVQVRDVNNCISSTFLIITEPDVLDVSITTSLWNNYQIRCNGDNSGYANITTSGGTNPYAINYFEPGNLLPISTSSTVSGLSSGIYNFEVIDEHGCTYSQTITYSEPDTIMHNFIPTHVNCSGWSNGSLIDSIYGGVGNPSTYIYSWNTGETTYSLDSIPIGTYIMTVVDENNCVNTGAYTINDDIALSATSSGINVSCFDYCDGEITVNASGGMPNINANMNIYNYQWNDTLFQTTSTAIGLCVNNNLLSTTYECLITDMQGCAVTLSETITQQDQLVVTSSIVNEILCYNGSTGKLNASASGGSGTYLYMWSNDAPTYSTNSNNNGVAAGDYVITVMDNKGCTAADFITLIEPSELSLTVSETSVTCFGYGDGKIEAVATNGTPFLGIPPKYLYNVTNEATGLSVYSNTISVGLAEGLNPGIYTITAEDMNGCAVESGTIYISEPGDSLSINFNTVDASCLQNNGSASIVAFGGTPVYLYNWDNNATAINNTNLDAGYYPVTVIDSRGCEIRDSAFVKGTYNVFADSLSEITFNICLGDSVLITINETPFNSYVWENGSSNPDRWVYPNNYVNIYTLTITDPTCPSSYEVVATVNVDFINPLPASNPGIEYGDFPVILAGDNIDLYSENITCVEYTWQWDNETISNSNGSITLENRKQSDWYYLYVKDNEGCLGYDSIYVVVGVIPYEAITPNNDGFNDTWTPLDIQSYENALVQVFNRWGGLIFESKGGEGYQAWDGSNSGKELPVGTYYYIIDLNTGDEPQTGPITIIR